MTLTVEACRQPVTQDDRSVLARVDAALDERPRWYWLMAALGASLLSLLVVVPVATAPGGLSPVDELWYVDSLDRAFRGELTRTGDQLGEYARQVKACRGVLGIHGGSSSCGAPQPDAGLPLGGGTSADIHPPTYFFLSAAVARGVLAVGVTNDLLIAGRLAGAVWLTLGLLMSIAAFRAWGAGRVVPLLTAAALGLTPLLTSVSAYVTPDALGLLVGATVLVTVARWARHDLPTVALGAVAFGTAFVKVPYILAPLFCALLLVFRHLAEPHARIRRTGLGVAVLGVSAALGAAVWQLLRGLLAVDEAPVHEVGSPRATLTRFVSYLGYYARVIPAETGAEIPVEVPLASAAQLLTILMIAAAVGGLLLLSPQHPLLPVCWAGTAAMLFGSIVLSGIVLAATGAFLIGTPRYGLALLPLWATPLAASRRGTAAAALGAVVALSLWSSL